MPRAKGDMQQLPSQRTFPCVCKGGASVREIIRSNDAYLGAISSSCDDKWMAAVDINGSPVTFEVDTGAAEISYRDKSAKANVYVVDGLHTPLLSRAASEKLGILKRLDEVTIQKSEVVNPEGVKERASAGAAAPCILLLKLEQQGT
ncbi:hypothetical protein HPB50_011823 [Hyalomma asiaticum]|uniref:Uncharacterized protein n=1 Tax=Hyalomma asiaticum TaxID=266040 RepID=A0ACB7TGC6_HYAAI|nr:hypothetical protein HPB50_011823 [Hyalomma asiaticum]